MYLNLGCFQINNEYIATTMYDQEVCLPLEGNAAFLAVCLELL